MTQAGIIKLEAKGDSATENNDIQSFTSVDFPTPFPEGTNVIVIPMVQTFNGSDTPGVRIAKVTNTGFKIRMNELVINDKNSEDGKKALSDGGHFEETVGWVAYSVSEEFVKS